MNPNAEEQKEPEVEPIPSAKSSTSNVMSRASQKFDMGNKGYLDEEERIIRQYDTNDDGELDVKELKAIIRDLKKEKKDKSTYMKLGLGSSGLLVLVLLANFGLIWAVVVLTRQVEMQNGKMVDHTTKEMVTTKAEGTGLNAKMDPTWANLMQNAEEENNRRNLRAGITNAPWIHPLHRLRADHEGVRHLQSFEIALANVTQSHAEVNAAFASYMNGQNSEANLIFPNGNTYSVRLASGIVQVNDDPDCPSQWRNIMEDDGCSCPKYNLKCCSGTDADDMCTLSIYEFCTGDNPNCG